MSTALTPPKIIPIPIPEEAWDDISWLGCKFSVDLPLKTFKIHDLLQLAPGMILESTYAKGADVPILVNAQIVGWAEFEVVGQRLGVRLTELA